MRDALIELLSEVAEERARQDAKWGPVSNADQLAIADGTGLDPAGDADILAVAREACEKNPTWRAILEEEVLEAFAEKDTLRLEEELFQVAAVAVKWIEALRLRRAAAPAELRQTCEVCGGTGGVRAWMNGRDSWHPCPRGCESPKEVR